MEHYLMQSFTTYRYFLFRHNLEVLITNDSHIRIRIKEKLAIFIYANKSRRQGVSAATAPCRKLKPTTSGNNEIPITHTRSPAKCEFS